MSVNFPPKCFFPHCTPHKCQFLGLTITEQAYQHYRGACPPCSGLPGKCACNGYACEQIHTFSSVLGVNRCVFHCSTPWPACSMHTHYSHVLHNVDLQACNEALGNCRFFTDMYMHYDQYVCYYDTCTAVLIIIYVPLCWLVQGIYLPVCYVCGTSMMHFANDMFICMCQCDACPLILYVFTCLLQWHYIC